MASSTHSTALQKRELRRALRAARRAVAGRAATGAARAVTARVRRLRAWRRARIVGVFVSGDGEIDTSRLMQAAWQAGKTVCLPVIQPPPGQRGRRAALREGRLVFRVAGPATPRRPGLLQVPEPVRSSSRAIPLNRIDLLLMPLVGFDSAGHRLGMGGGFYDRTLAGRGRFRRPCRVGIAHACQEVPALPHDPWDQPVETCVTDRKTHAW